MRKEREISAAADSAECSADITDQRKRSCYAGKDVCAGQGCRQKCYQQTYKIDKYKTGNAIHNVFPSRAAIQLDAEHAVRMQKPLHFVESLLA